MIKHVGLWAFVLGGVALVVWGILTMVAPSATCRGEQMRPGDVCHYYSATDTETERIQSYEQRIAAARGQGPTVIGLGVLAAAFGAFTGLRPGLGQRDQASSDIGP
ncbi:hypothetical protein LKO27_08510 [Tessaracoccus sp. OS52]|uniref:hypothetical protein n=1 Tax=Tessaracoccus sp. OS52 TaxID=2886691 RepID=UPI001D0F7A01|nr:hypothetical protein [Tessaracoccus sp. OS52]MCC2593448.1 hypothetical protein [Tessaracoccus sp. OS52]